MKKIILFAFIIISLFLINTALVHACSCALNDPPKEALEKSTAVFAGKVIDIETPGGTMVSSFDPVKVTFDVSTLWKGPDDKTLVVTTARSVASCGYGFRKDQEYMVYARGEEDALRTGICSRTTSLANAQVDLERLGEGLGEGKVPIPQPSNLFQIVLLIGALIVVIAIIIITVIVRKYKK